DRKAATLVRGRLQGFLAVPRAYDLDRLDLVAQSPLDGRVQDAATTLLRSLADPQAARAAGLYGFHLFEEDQDLSKIKYSFTLYERGEHANLLRVQTDNFDQPFDINEGARLDLGSTSKLRTLVTYLEMVAELHTRWGALAADELAALHVGRNDAIGAWARDYLAKAEDKGLGPMLGQAMERVYSANTAEGFLTGGGLHHFDNFDKIDDGRNMTVREALRRSVNLPFIRLMRDLVRHVNARSESESAALLDDSSDPRRREYLARFADKEGREFLAGFHRKYAGKSAAEIDTLLVQSARPTPARLAATLYGLEPDADSARLKGFIAQRLPGAELSDAALQALQEKYGADRWSLADRGHLAGLHPLELWIAAHLRQHPGAGLADAVAASGDARQAAYEWLFRTRSKDAQDLRIRNLLEVDAFAEIHRAWRRLGYPFEALTPSYASALGASGDRPAALAELMGIIVNGGLRLPVTRIDGLKFARGTPYETHLAQQPTAPQRVLPAEVAEVLRRALIGVVDDGTARRLKGAMVRHDGSTVPIGGKTGTGDQRFDVYARGGRLVSSRVVNRTATLVFLMGDRHFGTLMAYVPEPYAANYKFTSALPSQLLKALLPSLLPLVDGAACAGTGALDERLPVEVLVSSKR
ncbi:MAG: glycosyl transferase family 51, partial [Rubrivivax sp.]